jgi:hypothetical protein
MVNRVSFTMLLNYNIPKTSACNIAIINNHILRVCCSGIGVKLIFIFYFKIFFSDLPVTQTVVFVLSSSARRMLG